TCCSHNPSVPSESRDGPWGKSGFLSHWRLAAVVLQESAWGLSSGSAPGALRGRQQIAAAQRQPLGGLPLRPASCEAACNGSQQVEIEIQASPPLHPDWRAEGGSEGAWW